MRNGDRAEAYAVMRNITPREHPPTKTRSIRYMDLTVGMAMLKEYLETGYMVIEGSGSCESLTIEDELLI
jgi:hypothetical protein